MKNTYEVILIGSGLGALALACLLGKKGKRVLVLEKNNNLGGRINTFSEEGYTFDMGPSWMLMPDFFEHFFSLIEEPMEDYLKLVKLSPSYKVYYKDRSTDPVVIYSDIEKDSIQFEKLEPGSTQRIKAYLEVAEKMYKASVENFIYRNYDSPTGIVSKEILKAALRYPLFKNAHKHIASYVSRPELQQILELPFMFLGNSPFKSPAVYSVLNYTDLVQGVKYPLGGFYTLVTALETIASKYDVTFMTETPVEQIIVKNGQAEGVATNRGDFFADEVVSNADPYFTDMTLLQEDQRIYSEQQWNKKKLAPSAHIMYLGVDGAIPELEHHSFLVSKRWEQNYRDVFENVSFPFDPSLYLCKPGVVDPQIQPEGKTQLFVLVPISAGVTYSDSEKEDFSEKILSTIEDEISIKDFRKRINYMKTFSVKEFQALYNSYKGTGLGMNHVLTQTGPFRFNNVHKSIKNLYYVGANTHPGIGLPMCLASAEVLYKRMAGINTAERLESL